MAAEKESFIFPTGAVDKHFAVYYTAFADFGLSAVSAPDPSEQAAELNVLDRLRIAVCGIGVHIAGSDFAAADAVNYICLLGIPFGKNATYSGAVLDFVESDFAIVSASLENLRIVTIGAAGDATALGCYASSAAVYLKPAIVDAISERGDIHHTGDTSAAECTLVLVKMFPLFSQKEIVRFEEAPIPTIPPI